MGAWQERGDAVGENPVMCRRFQVAALRAEVLRFEPAERAAAAERAEPGRKAGAFI